MLYALPDHEVMESLLEGIAGRDVPVAEARAAIAEHPGLTPVAIHPGDEPQAPGRIYFADIGDAPFVEWKHIYTIERLAGEGRIKRYFSTGLELLDEPLPVDEGMAPDGLFFHVSRCGSTLFCKALARLESNLIINQAGPLQSGFWAALTGHWQHPLEASEENLARFRRLIVLLTRRRRPEYRRCFIKFISWNVICMDFVRAAFPRTRALYLYRDPVEVIATVLQETTAALNARGTALGGVLAGLSAEQTRGMDKVEFLARCYARYFSLVAERAGPLELGLVNYRQMRRPECFPVVLDRGLGWQPAPEELERMLEQYGYYSKDDSNRTRYRGEPEKLAEALGEHGREIAETIAGGPCRELDRSPRNLFLGNSE